MKARIGSNTSTPVVVDPTFARQRSKAFLKLLPLFEKHVARREQGLGNR
jgi:hypothetical protein